MDGYELMEGIGFEFDGCEARPWLDRDGLDEWTPGAELKFPNDGPPLAAWKASLYEEDGAYDGIDCCKNGELDSGPNDDGELIEDPNEPLNGDWDPSEG